MTETTHIAIALSKLRVMNIEETKEGHDFDLTEIVRRFVDSACEQNQGIAVAYLSCLD